ncbi:MAG: helix-turn-helix domain-containing protein [Bosea sp. (in: a-proteobacteria)]
MTPFGAKVRELRAARGMTLSDMAERLGVSPAYLSALEHGKRGKPPFALMQGIIHVLGVIWDEADDLVRLVDLSDPRVVIDTAGLEPEATRLANHLASVISELTPEAIGQLQGALDAAAPRGSKPIDVKPRE